MSTDLDSLLKAALQLSDDERARLVDSLLSTLEPPSEPGVDQAWAAEIERRSREFDEGKVKPIPWSEVRESVRKQFASNG